MLRSFLIGAAGRGTRKPDRVQHQEDDKTYHPGCAKVAARNLLMARSHPSFKRRGFAPSKIWLKKQELTALYYRDTKAHGAIDD